MDYHQPHLCTTLVVALLLVCLPLQTQATQSHSQKNPHSLKKSVTPITLSTGDHHPISSNLESVTHQQDHEMAPDPLHRVQKDPTRLHLHLGFPIPIGLGIHQPLSSVFSLNVTATYLPLPFIRSGTLITAAFDTFMQWHPFENGFFLFGGLGVQSFFFHTSLNLGRFSDTPGPERGSVSLTRIYSSVGIGIAWLSGPRISLESDIGLQIPISKSGKISFDTSSEAKSSLEEASRDALSYYAGFALPRLTLIRIGIKI